MGYWVQVEPWSEDQLSCTLIPSIPAFDRASLIESIIPVCEQRARQSVSLKGEQCSPKKSLVTFTTLMKWYLETLSFILLPHLAIAHSTTYVVLLLLPFVKLPFTGVSCSQFNWQINKKVKNEKWVNLLVGLSHPTSG